MRAARSGRTARLRQPLTVAEIALALMLVVAAGLLVRTFRSLGALELGFDPEKVTAVGLSIRISRNIEGPAKAQFEAELIARMRGISGVVAAGIGSRPLMSEVWDVVLAPAGGAASDENPRRSVGPGYLEALGARLERPIRQRRRYSGWAGCRPGESNGGAPFLDGAGCGRSAPSDRAGAGPIVGVLADVRPVS